MLQKLGPIAGASATNVSPEDKQARKTKEAATQFESLMIGELLKSARSDSDSSGWLGAGESDQASGTALDYADQQFASVLARNGGLGLAKVIQHDLEKSGK